MLNTSIAQIDLGALRHNLSVVRELCPESRILAMVKADAYGHGLLEVARALENADGFAVARLQEAMALRNAGVCKRIVLLATLLDETDLKSCSNQQIDVTAHNELLVASIASLASRWPIRVWLKLDSGMHRTGLDPGAFVASDRLLRAQGVLELIHMTHFSSATASSPTVLERQLSCFWDCHQASSNSAISLANSAALIARPDTRVDWVRPGIMLYGDNPWGHLFPTALRTAMSLHSRVIAIRDISANESVGYDETWSSTRPSRIATVGIGYGDGYPLRAANGTPVWINGQTASLVGRVSMDSITVDVTDYRDIAIGDEVLLWGAPVPVATVAQFAQTTSYQLLTSVNNRVTRRYLEDSTTL